VPGRDLTKVFDTVQGLGTLSLQITDPGVHTVRLFLDLEVDQRFSTWFNEYGGTSGTPATGQSWEIDEPGWKYGDIYSNFENGTLDNKNGVPITATDDVSYALSWIFTVGQNETANVYFQTSRDQLSPFYLVQTDPYSDANVYFSSSLQISGNGVPDGGATCAMLSMALAGLFGWNKKMNNGVKM